MGRDCVVFKGTRTGVCITVKPGAGFHEFIAELRDKLSYSADFFADSVVWIDLAGRELNREVASALRKLEKEFNIHLRIGTGENPGPDKDMRSNLAAEFTGEPTLFYRRTMRSGQRIEFRGNVVVIGDVNPGAEIIADGDVIILGTLRGMVHAGAVGSRKAVVIGLRLQPTQLRIGDLITRAPDDGVFHSGDPEMASVKGDFIVISDYGKSSTQ